MRKLLLERQGYRVITATTAREGVVKFRQSPVALVILDYYLPDGTGEVVARELKNLKPHVPILMLSGAVDLPEDMAEVDLVLSKVESPPVFLEAVAELLTGKQPLEAAG